MATNSYDGRIDLLASVGCEVDGEARISAIVDDFVCLQDAEILGVTVSHIWVKIKGHFKAKGDRVKFKGKVKLYHKQRKVGLGDVLFF